MDRRERVLSPTDALQLALDAHQMGVWTAMPGVVKRYSAGAGTVDVQLAIQAAVKKPDQAGTLEWINIALLTDCPVYFPAGGGFTLTFPIEEGDECLMVFASRCINVWYQNGGTSNQQEEFRMHDLSDGFAFVGFRSLPRVLSPAASTTAVQLRSDDGQTKIEIRGDLKAAITAPAEITLTAPLVKIVGNGQVTGNLQVDGNITATGTITGDDVFSTASPANISLQTHVHHIAGAGDTDPPKQP